VYPDDGADAATLLRNADRALFHAKAHGRSKHQFFQPTMGVCALEADGALETIARTGS
jgi:predicted signal transduction protein with EAL and GGDEF domain